MKYFYSYLLILYGFTCGLIFAVCVIQAPKVEKQVVLQQELIQSQQTVDMYRQRCIDWSNYVFRLQRGNDDYGR